MCPNVAKLPLEVSLVRGAVGLGGDKMKLNIGDVKSKKTYQIDIEESNNSALMGKKISETFKGESIDKPGYEFEITGGSDKAGFPMRLDVNGDVRRKILITKSVGNRKNRKGLRLRRTVTGNTIGAQTSQVNVKITKYGAKPIIEAPAEEKAEEKKE